MASPMMYEMVNAILSAQQRGFRFPTTDLAEFVALCANGITNGEVVLIDMQSTLDHFYVDRQDGTYQIDGSYIQSITKHLSDEKRMPFPAVLLCWAAFTKQGRRQHAMLVVEKDGKRFCGRYVFELTKTGVLAAYKIESTYRKNFPVDSSGDLSIADVLVQITRVINALRNTTWPEQTTPRPVRRRHQALAGVKFRTVAIETKKRARGDTRSDEELGTGVAWHKRRGHIAVYTAERPLRTPTGGTYVGEVWRPATEVGDKKNGIVVQDYVVRPPEL